MGKQTLNLGRALGIGALCIMLAAAPIVSGSMPNFVSAAGGSGCFYGGYDFNKQLAILNAWGEASDKFSTEAVQDLINSVKTLPDYERYAKFFDVYLTDNWNAGDAGRAALATLKDEVTALGIEPESISNNWGQLDNTLYDIKKSGEYKSNADLRAAVAKARAVNQDYVDSAVAAALELKPDAALDNVVSFWDIRDAIEQPFDEEDLEVKGYSEYLNYYGLYNATMGSAMNSSSKHVDYFTMLCLAKQVNPAFEVQHRLAADPLVELVNPWTSSENNGGDNTGDNTGNKPTTPTQPIIIESNDKNVKVSGININVNYTLNVNVVSTDNLKLTGDNFKNSLNQSFYDIYVQDEHGNRVSDTGKVQVSIKLPSNMSVNSDFVVYYVPTGANGEHLTNQAQAIKGVKVSKDGWLTFETDHFSVYGIVEYVKGKAPNTGVVAQSETSATTTGIKAIVGLISTLAVAGAGIVARRQTLRKKANNKQ